MEKNLFGKLPSGENVHEYILKSEGITLSVLDFGGIIHRFIVDGIDIVAGFDTLDGYLEDGSYQGAFIGRYGNRINSSTFTLNGKEYKLSANEGRHHLHGGKKGFNRKLLTVESVTDSAITFSYVSPDGEEGYPGTLKSTVTYALSDNALSLHYTAVTDKDTVVNLTNHAYYNLNGYGNSDILSHILTLYADEVTEVDSELIPTGKRIPVENTVYDFNTPHTIGERVGNGFGGYDTNFVLKGGNEQSIAGYRLPLIANVKADKLSMNVYTNQPCVQLYIGNMLTGAPAMKGGKPKMPHCTFCLETQVEPDSPNRNAAILRKGETYEHITVYEVKPLR